MDEDGIEDLHFYFVSFHSHKTKVLNNREGGKFRRNKHTKDNKNDKLKINNKSKGVAIDDQEKIRTIESVSDADLD